MKLFRLDKVGELQTNKYTFIADVETVNDVFPIICKEQNLEQYIGSIGRTHDKLWIDVGDRRDVFYYIDDATAPVCFSVFGGKAKHEATYKQLEDNYRWAVRDAYMEIKIKGMYIPLPMSVAIQISVYTSSRENGKRYMDISRIENIICNALSHIAFHNKSQITNLEVKKYQSETPRVEISIRAVNIPKI